MDTNLEKMAKLRRRSRRRDGDRGQRFRHQRRRGCPAAHVDEMAKNLGLKPLARDHGVYLGRGRTGLHGPRPDPGGAKDPSKKTGLSLDDFGVIGLNEAFAAQAIGCLRELKFDLEKTNLLGSGISIGHPIGCTGARIVLALAPSDGAPGPGIWTGDALHRRRDQAWQPCLQRV